MAAHLHEYLLLWDQGCMVFLHRPEKNVKTPGQRLQQAVRWAGGLWDRDELKNHLDNMLSLHLRVMGIDWHAGPEDLEQQQKILADILEFCLTVASNRAWSMENWKALV